MCYIYQNYDCDLQCSNLFDTIIHTLCIRAIPHTYNNNDKKAMKSNNQSSQSILNNIENGFIYNKVTISTGIIDLKFNSFNFKNELYIIIEGFLLFYWKEIVDLCDIKYFIDCKYEICKDRRYFRDYKDIQNKYGLEYALGHKKEFDKWYENIVYKYYLLYIETQLQNLNNDYKKITS